MTNINRIDDYLRKSTDRNTLNVAENIWLNLSDVIDFTPNGYSQLAEMFLLFIV